MVRGEGEDVTKMEGQNANGCKMEEDVTTNEMQCMISHTTGQNEKQMLYLNAMNGCLGEMSNAGTCNANTYLEDRMKEMMDGNERVENAGGMYERNVNGQMNGGKNGGRKCKMLSQMMMS